MRVFPESKGANVSCRVLPKQNDTGVLEIELQDRYGNRPVRIVFTDDGQIKAMNGGNLVNLQPYKAQTWYDLDINVKTKDAANSSFSVEVNGNPVLRGAAFAGAVESVERLSLRTGPFRTDPTRRLDRYDKRLKDLPNADDPVALAVYHVDDVVATPR